MTNFSIGSVFGVQVKYAGYTDILASAGYKMTTVSNRYDLAAALSVLVFLVIGILTFINMKASHSFEEAG